MAKKRKQKDENKPSKLKELAAKFKFNNHYKMERFVVITIIFAVLFSGVLTGATLKYRGLVKINETNTAVYTPEFSSSLTQTHGNVLGVYRSKD